MQRRGAICVAGMCTVLQHTTLLPPKATPFTRGSLRIPISRRFRHGRLLGIA
jgi:hypothetical protein